MLFEPSRWYLGPREPSAGSEGDGDGGVEVGAGDVADGVHHDHDHQPPHDAYPGERHRPLAAEVDRHRGAAGEDDEVGAEHLGDDLRCPGQQREHVSAKPYKMEVQSKGGEKKTPWEFPMHDAERLCNCVIDMHL